MNTTPADAQADAQIPVAAIALLALAAFASGISLRLTDPLLPFLAHEFSIDVGHAAQVITAFSIAYGLSQLFFGPLGDRHGKYLVIAWACAACALSAALCAWAPGFNTLLAGRLLSGMTAGAIIPLSMAWIGDTVPYARRQPVIARFLIGQIMGLAAGVLVGGYAADHLDRHAPFAALAAVFALVSGALHALNRRLPDAARARRVPASGPVLQRMAGEFAAVLRLPWARVVLWTVFLEGASLYGAFAFIATHLHLRFGLTLTHAGAMVMLFGMGGLLFALVAQWLVRRLGEAGMARWGGAIMAAGLLAIAAAPAWGWAAPACFATGLGFYMLHNTLQTNATQMAPERRGAAVAAFASSFFLGQSAGVALGGLAVAQLGTAAVIATGGVGVLAVGLNFARLRAGGAHAPAHA